jgi:hypothetical protein
MIFGKSIASEFRSYRSVITSLWNERFLIALAEDHSRVGELEEIFMEMASLLFGVMVLREFNIHSERLRLPSRVGYPLRDPVRDIRLSLSPDVLIYKERDSGSFVDCSSRGLDLFFVDFFDWDLYGERSFEWVRAQDDSASNYLIRFSDVSDFFMI